MARSGRNEIKPHFFKISKMMPNDMFMCGKNEEVIQDNWNEQILAKATGAHAGMLMPRLMDPEVEFWIIPLVSILASPIYERKLLYCLQEIL